MQHGLWKSVKIPTFSQRATVFSLELNEHDKLTLDLLQSNRPSIGQDL